MTSGSGLPDLSKLSLDELTAEVESLTESITMLDRLATKKHREAQSLAYRRERKRDRRARYLGAVMERKSERPS